MPLPAGRNFSFTNIRLDNVKVLADVGKISAERPLDGLILSNITGACVRGIILDNITNALLDDIHVSGYDEAHC